ncbi:MAG: UPF0175 family protein [Chloroflexi bacterium]|nr:UPF0175 family protein [Chloroflexota bacterium]
MSKKEQMVGTRLPESLIADLLKIEQIEQTDRSTVLRKLLSRALREWKLEYYAHEYGRGRMTLGRAAEEAGVSLWEMMDYVRQMKIPAQYSLDDLKHDIKLISGAAESKRGSRSRVSSRA